MEQFYYLFALLFSLAGLGFIDWLYKIAFAKDWRRALKTLSGAVGVFIIWDLILIGFGVVSRGSSPYSLPFTLLPDFPLEEILFLILLCYCVLLVYMEVPRWRRMR